MATSAAILFVTAILMVSEHCCTATEYYVSAADGPPCPNNTICYPLSHYVNQSHLYFTSDTVFYFMEGTHHLLKTLWINSVSNLTFEGLGSLKQGFHETVLQSTSIIQCPDVDPFSVLTITYIEVGYSHLITISHLMINGCAEYLAYDTGIALHYVSIQNGPNAYGFICTGIQDITISSCSFTGNRAPIEIYNGVDDVIHSHIILINIENSNISFNNYGLQISLYSSNAVMMSIDNVTFHNIGDTACIIEGTFHTQTINILNTTSNVNISNTVFSKNTQRAMEVEHLGGNALLILNNVTVLGNGIHQQIYSSIIKIQGSQYFIPIIINSTFYNNYGTVLWFKNRSFFGGLITLTFQGINTFKGNIGYNGGAMAIDPNSQIMIDRNKHTAIFFTNNHALNHGGAIYVPLNVDEDGFQKPKPYCFYTDYFQYESQVFYFSNNSAANAGSAIYGSNVSICASFSEMSNISNKDQVGYSVISSEIVKVCFCDELCSKPLCSVRNYTVTAVPGQIINFTAAAVGDADGLTEGVLQIIDDFSVTNKNLSAKCILIHHIMVQVKSHNKTSAIKIAAVVSPEVYVLPLNIIVHIAPCPAGFYLSTDTHKCECYSTISSVAKCNTSTGTVTREGNMWLAYNKQDNCTIVHTECPFDYCKTDSVTLSLDDPNIQCSLGRADRYCGGCQYNYSLLLGSNRCQKCAPTKSTLLLVIPLALAGIALVALLIALKAAQ